MGLFSRKKHVRTSEPGAGGAGTGPAAGAADETGAPGDSDADAVAGGAVPGSAPEPATARLTSAGLTTASTPGAPGWDVAAGGGSGLVEHRSLQAALAVWGRQKDSVTFHDVVRELTAGELLLDIGSSTIADRSAGLQKGDTLAIAHQVDSAGKRVLLAFTSNDRLARWRGTDDTTSLGQPAAAVVAQAMQDYEGLALDPGSPETQFIAYTDELSPGLGGDVGAVAPLKRALVERDQPWPEVLEMLRTSSSIYRAELEHRGDDGMPDGVEVPSARDAEGRSWSVVHTSPAEVFTWAPGASAQRVPLSRVAALALEHGHAGIVVDPRGPSVSIVEHELRAIVAHD